MDASLDPRAEPTTIRAAWEKIRENVEIGACLYIPSCGLRLTGIAEANTQQAFLDVLDNDVIKPLATLKASQEVFIWADDPVLIMRQSGRNRKMRQEGR